MTFDLWNQICSSLSQSWHFIWWCFYSTFHEWLTMGLHQFFPVCVRSAVGSNAQAVFTRVRNESEMIIICWAWVIPASLFKAHGAHGGADTEGRRARDPSRCSPSPRKQLSRLHNWNRSSKHTEGAWSRESELQLSSSEWQCFQHVEFLWRGKHLDDIAQRGWLQAVNLASWPWTMLIRKTICVARCQKATLAFWSCVAAKTMEAD